MRLVQTSLLLVELPANAWRKFACGSWTRVLPERTTQPEYQWVASRVYLPKKFIALPVTTINARITVLKIVNTWIQCNSFVGHGRQTPTNIHETNTQSWSKSMQRDSEDDD